MDTSYESQAVQYSVVIPVYQGQDTLRPLTQQLRDFFANAGYSHEIILVYDCGPDASWQLIAALRSEMGAHLVKAIRLARNFGQHNALICGFSYAKGQFIITMDEDLQHSPHDITLLITAQQTGGYDVVYGKYVTLKHSVFRNLTSHLFKKIVRLAIPDLHPDYTSFRLLKAEIAHHCERMNNPYTFLDGYLTWLTRNVGSVPVVQHERKVGASSYTLRKLVEHSISILVTFSNLPVRILTGVSLGLLVLTILYGMRLAYANVFLDEPPAAVASLLLISGFAVGFIGLGLGVLGEYIYRINLKSTHRPNFVVAEAQL